MTQQDLQEATYSDLEAVPSELVAEIINGRLITHPRPAPRHGAAASALIAELSLPYQRGVGGPGGWIFIVEPELHLGRHVAVPDIAGWRRERLPREPVTAFIEVAPDWLCENLSPSTETYDRGPKRQIYGEYGVQHLWLLDPRPKILEVFENRDGRWLLAGVFENGDEVVAPPFAEARFPLDRLWPFDQPGAPQG